jgi:hypothetical protein
LSRFLGSYRRLRKRVERLKVIILVDGLGQAMGHYTETGELPKELWLRAAVLRHEQFARLMSGTMPQEPGPGDLCSHMYCTKGHCRALDKKGGVEG